MTTNKLFYFESAYKPKTLRNWEVPKLYPATPRRRTGKTKIIANERGHILPEIKHIKKKSSRKYTNTWNLPKKIDAETAKILNGTSKKDKKKLELTESGESEDQEVAGNKTVPYVPGDLTEPKYRLASHDVLAQNRFNDKEAERRNGYPRYGDDFSRVPSPPPPNLSEKVEEVVKNCREMVSGKCKEEDSGKKNALLSPIINAISNFNLAKKLHRENLEHDPLPDTITNSIYRKLQIQRVRDHDPGLTLEDKNFACGVGWKGYPGFGPTRCTKLKVYRPKSCAHHPKTMIDDQDRPSSTNSFDRKWRFIRQNKVKPIDLAICWDLAPVDPDDEPKPPPHIDGSNGSQAPAVFSLVHTPKDECENLPKCDGVHACGTIFEHGARGNQAKDFIFDRPRTGASKDTSTDRKRAKSAHDLHENKTHSRSTSEKSTKSSGSSKSTRPHHRSSPNLGTPDQALPPCQQHSCKKIGKRLCVACELKKVPGERKLNSEYKMAFKAGVPQKYNYKREDYPEHWRLATVYQHSYKPINLRKRNLLQTVYK